MKVNEARAITIGVWMMKRPKYYIFCLSIIIGLVGAALFEAKRNEIFLRETVRILFDDPGINYLGAGLDSVTVLWDYSI
jgi:hypothetical protein